MNLLKDTRNLLSATKLTVQQLARKTRLKVRWLHRFKNDDFEDYGVKKVQKVHDVLKKDEERNL